VLEVMMTVALPRRTHLRALNLRRDGLATGVFRVRDAVPDLFSWTVRGFILLETTALSTILIDWRPAMIIITKKNSTHHVLEEDLQNSAGFLVDEAADPLHAATAGEAADRRLGDALDVVPEDLPVALGAALAQSLSTLAAAGHD